MTDTVDRVAVVTTTDVPGLVGTDTAPVGGVPNAWVAAAIARRTATLRRFLDAVTTAPLTSKPWVPDLTVGDGGGLQPAEKQPIPDLAALTINGQTLTPALYGAAANVSWQVYSQASAVIDLLLREAALRQTVAAILFALTDGLTPAADFGAAAATVEGNGWPVDFVAGPTAGVYAADLTNLDLMGLAVYGGVPSDVLIVGSTAGVWCQTTETDLQVAEPAIGGYEVSAFMEMVVQVTPGSVATVAVV